MDSRTRLICFDSGDCYSVGAAAHLASSIRAAVVARGHCSLMLAGGSTPRAVYQQLSREELPWQDISIYFGDERCVPPDHDESNFRMATEAFAHGGLQDLAMDRIKGEAENPEAEARRYEAILPGRIDVLVLGIGEDAHTASLFPGSPLLADTHGHMAVVTGPKPPNPRITITPNVIKNAREIVVLVTGAAKAAVLREVLEGPLDVTHRPVQLALGGTWLVDDSAASRLSES